VSDTSVGRSETGSFVVDGGPDFCRSRFASNLWTRRAATSCTADCIHHAPVKYWVAHKNIVNFGAEL